MNLKMARLSRNMTQWNVSLLTKIHQSKLSLFERNYIQPSNEEKAKIANALGYKVEEIF